MSISEVGDKACELKNKVYEAKSNALIEHKLGLLRDETTGTMVFRSLVAEITEYLCYMAMEDAKMYKTEISTPVCKTVVRRIDEHDYIFVYILRAGIGMMDGVHKIIPNSKDGMIGMYRDEETHMPVEYFYKALQHIENVPDKQIIICDPMLATGGSMIDAIERVKKDGARKIKCLSIFAAPEGIKAIQDKHPEVEIFCAAIEKGLNENKYIIPGCGDAGDRIFGIK